jgi:hypothetical protein
MVQIHRCPATVSGTKSAKTTEVLAPWEGAESRETPRARRPALPSAETSFRGKGAAACVPTPTVSGWGFFLRAASPAVCGSPSSPCWGSGGQREASRGSSRSIASLSLRGPRRHGEQRMVPRPACAHASSHTRRAPRVLGFLDRVHAPQHTPEQSQGSLPVLGVVARETSGKRPLRRRALEWQRCKTAASMPRLPAAAFVETSVDERVCS